MIAIDNVFKTVVYVAMLMIYKSNSKITLLSQVCLISLNRVCIFRDALSYTFRGAKNLIFMKSEMKKKMNVQGTTFNQSIDS